MMDFLVTLALFLLICYGLVLLVSWCKDNSRKRHWQENGKGYKI